MKYFSKELIDLIDYISVIYNDSLIYKCNFIYK